jgi:hypothetical protein
VRGFDGFVWRSSASQQIVLIIPAAIPARPWLPLSRAAASILLLSVAACIQPPTTASVAIPPIPPQQARVWFYRDVEPHAVNQTTPYVRLNGAIAGVADQGGAFYRDVPPGHYQIMIEGGGMSPSPSRDVALLAGEQVYVKIGLGASWNGQGFTIAVEPSEVGRAAIEHSKFYGGRELSANAAGA